MGFFTASFFKGGAWFDSPYRDNDDMAKNPTLAQTARMGHPKMQIKGRATRPENLDKNIPSANRAEKRHAPVTAERNKMKMPASVDPNEFVGHGVEGAPNPDPSKIAKGLPPGKTKPITPC